MYYGMIITDGMIEVSDRDIITANSKMYAYYLLDEAVYEIKCEICDYSENPEDYELFGDLYEIESEKDFEDFKTLSLEDIELKYRRA